MNSLPKPHARGRSLVASAGVFLVAVLGAASAAGQVTADDVVAALDVPDSFLVSATISAGPGVAVIDSSYGGILATARQQFVAICTGVADCVGALAEPGTDLGLPGVGDDTTVITLELDVPSHIRYVSFSYQVLTAEYPEANVPLRDFFDVTWTQDQQSVSLLPPGAVIQPAPTTLVQGTCFDVFDEGSPDAGFEFGGLVKVPVPSTGQVTVAFTVADGVDAFRDTCLFIDRFSLTSFEVVDAIPELVDANGSITNNLADLATKGEERAGASADGVTKVVLREEVALPPPGVVEFSLDEGVYPEDGGLSLRNSSALSQTVTANVETVNIDGPDKYFAFAVYTAPLQFDRDANDADASEREVGLTARYCPGGVCVPEPPNVEDPLRTRLPFKLVRPPVVLIHGMWSSQDTWKFPLAKKPLSDRYHVRRSNYRSTNASWFSTNSDKPRYDIIEALRGYHQDDLAATQADVIAHSMGGVLTRRFIGMGDDWYTTQETFRQGYIHKFMAMNTPNAGSPLANLNVALLNIPCVTISVFTIDFEICVSDFIAEFMDRVDHPIDEGCMHDMRVCSAALQAIPDTPVASHAFVGSFQPTFADLESAFESLFDVAREICRFVRFLANLTSITTPDLCVVIDSLEDMFFETYQQAVGNDSIVGDGSQAGSIDQSTVIGAPDGLHTKVTASDVHSNLLVNLLNESSDAGNFDDLWDSPATHCASSKSQDTISVLEMLTQGEPPPEDLMVSATPPYLAGQPVSITVTAPSGNMERVMIVGASAADVDSTSPYVMTIEIPPEVIGDYDIRAGGFDADGVYHLSNVMTLTVGSASPLFGIEIPNGDVVMEPGEVELLSVLGKYDEAGETVLRDLTRLTTGTTYTSTAPSIATVDLDGRVDAKTPGTAVVIARNGGFAYSILVTVVDEGTPTANAGYNRLGFLGVPTILAGSGFDPDGEPEPLSFLWEQTAGVPVALTGANTPSLSFTPDEVGEYNFQLTVTDGKRPSVPDHVTVTVGATAAPDAPSPRHFVLHPARPNPFNPWTEIRYELATSAFVELNIYNLSGRLVRRLVNEVQEAGSRRVIWNARDDANQQVASGTYFYRIAAEGWTETRRVVLLK